jgi:hypothetical protein
MMAARFPASRDFLRRLQQMENDLRDESATHQESKHDY